LIETKSAGKILLTAVVIAGMVMTAVAQDAAPKLTDKERVESREIFKELIEINSSDSTGNNTTVARAMEKRFLDAGFPAADVVLLEPKAGKGDLVVRYRGKANSGKKAILLIGHIDVVEARRADWTTDPYVFTEKDGYFYGRGTQDMKDEDAAMVEDFIRLRREGFVPDRDIVLALTADEESGGTNGVE
jgi:acetylornithine deacetylase/succinyl-diaminopimelate desuccinylase-like protein